MKKKSAKVVSSYTTISISFILYRSLFVTLTPTEKLFFLFINILCSINQASKGNRSIDLSAKQWAKKLNCSTSKIFAMQSKLKRLGYLEIQSDKTEEGRDKKNILTATLPDEVFNELCKTPDRIGAKHISYKNKIEHLENTKQWIPIKYNTLKTIFGAENISPALKLMMINFLALTHISSRKHKDRKGFLINTEQLTTRFNCSAAYISKTLKALHLAGFIFYKRRIKEENDEFGTRKDMSFWYIEPKLPSENQRDKSASLYESYNNYDDAYLFSEGLINELTSEEQAPVGKPSPYKTHADAKLTKIDPQINQTGYLYKKETITDKSISNLGTTSKVFSSKNKKSKFDICTELVRGKLKSLAKEKADKARKFAYSLFSKGLVKGEASKLSKHELAKQLLIHTSAWKPDKLIFLRQEDKIDTALAFAWKSLSKGEWRTPFIWEKAQILQWEFESHCQKYKDSGFFSPELGLLEREASQVLGLSVNLKERIIEIVEADRKKMKEKTQNPEQQKQVFSSFRGDVKTDLDPDNTDRKESVSNSIENNPNIKLFKQEERETKPKITAIGDITSNLLSKLSPAPKELETSKQEVLDEQRKFR